MSTKHFQDKQTLEAIRRENNIRAIEQKARAEYEAAKKTLIPRKSSGIRVVKAADIKQPRTLESMLADIQRIGTGK